MKIEWIRCSVCGNKTRLIIQLDIVLENFLLYYPKCKQETLINIKQLIFQLSKSRYTDTEPIIYENISRGYRLFIYLKLKLKQFTMQKVQKNRLKLGFIVEINRLFYNVLNYLLKKSLAIFEKSRPFDKIAG